MTSPLTEARMILFLESRGDSGKRNVGAINERRWLQDDFRILVASFDGSGTRDWARSECAPPFKGSTAF